MNLQLNIVSLPAYTSAALAAGLLMRPSAGPRTRKPLLWIVLLFAAASTAYSLRLAAADRDFKLAREASGPDEAGRLYRSALALDPCELNYHLGYVNVLSDLAGKTGRSGAHWTRRTASRNRARRRRPATRTTRPAHLIAGSGALRQALSGRPERLAAAEAQLDAALRLDPYRLDVLDWRRQAASLRGDKNLETALLERIARVKALH